MKYYLPVALIMYFAILEVIHTHTRSVNKFQDFFSPDVLREPT